MQIFSRFFKNDKGKYKIIDYLKRNKIEGDIMYSSAKRLDNKVNIPTEVGYDLEEECNFEKNIICLYKTTTDLVADVGSSTANHEAAMANYDQYVWIPVAKK